MIRFFKKYHKWLGVLFTLFLVFFALSGIILNHRGWFSSVDVDRSFLPGEYQYANWNLAAVRGAEPVGTDSILVYGNIGVWLTDSSYTRISDFNRGFPEGMDNRKTDKVYRSKKGDIFAGTLFGLYRFDRTEQQWQHITLSLHNQRIVDIDEKQDTLLVLSRSYLLTSVDGRSFTKHVLPPPEHYDGLVGLFKTLWVIHSGEIYGEAGKLFVDFVGLVLVFLTITGIIYFGNTYEIRRRRKRRKDFSGLRATNNWNIKWHNRIGWITLIVLVITTLTGMFLRPPLLIAIAETKVGKIPFTLLDTDNAWFDRLRRIMYVEEEDRYIIGTNEGVYYADGHFGSTVKAYPVQPPISVMGINAFERVGPNTMLVGSFEGLFLWHTESGAILDYITRTPYRRPARRGPPIGQHVVAGYIGDFRGEQIYFDYGRGAQPLTGRMNFPPMPEPLRTQPMSLWNLMLEVHTARIFQPLIGGFYILIVPVVGIVTLFVLISGFVVWYKRHRKASQNNGREDPGPEPTPAD